MYAIYALNKVTFLIQLLVLVMHARIHNVRDHISVHLRIPVMHTDNEAEVWMYIFITQEKYSFKDFKK